ncbi:hypothetical protein D3C81_804920 [compost metagenome]
MELRDGTVFRPIPNDPLSPRERVRVREAPTPDLPHHPDHHPALKWGKTGCFPPFHLNSARNYMNPKGYA